MVMPIFKWTGGKGRMWDQYAPVFFPPSEPAQFVDLFFGAGSVSGWMVHRFPTITLVVNDINAELVALYRFMRDDYDALAVEFAALSAEFLAMPDTPNGPRKTFYNACLHRYAFNYANERPAVLYAMLLFMLKTSFNGMWKGYNKYGGRFSTPPGTLQQAPEFFDGAPNFAFAKMLQRATIHCGSYERITPKKGAYVYADPPYRTSIVEYQNNFTDAHQVQLAEYLKAHHKRGCYVSESNRDDGSSFWLDLFPNPPYHVHPFDVRYTAGRGVSVVDAKEVLITNWKPEPEEVAELW